MYIAIVNSILMLTEKEHAYLSPSAIQDFVLSFNVE